MGTTTPVGVISARAGPGGAGGVVVGIDRGGAMAVLACAVVAVGTATGVGRSLLPQLAATRAAATATALLSRLDGPEGFMADGCGQ